MANPVDKRARQDRYIPGRIPTARLSPQEMIEKRKRLFDGLNKFVMDGGGWITSIQGAAEVTMETLQGSTLPDELHELGYDLTELAPGQRIIAGTIVERLTMTSSGAFEPATEGSTKPIIERSHAGIVPTQRFTFALP